MRVLIAPQEFKGSLTAAEAAHAIAAGLRRAQPAWQLDLLPMSDGGPGFLDALDAALPCESTTVPSHDALGRPVPAEYLLVKHSRAAVIESALANGLMQIRPGERDPLAADTFGVGEIIGLALSAHPASLVIGVGGSATTDGGAGMARALGARLLDGDGRALGPGGGPLTRLATIEWQRPPDLEGVDVVVATDVTNPLLGANGAAAIYGPQKGATPAQVIALDQALANYGSVIQRALGVDVSTAPGGGAAGGLAAGLIAFLGARVASGFDVVADVSQLRERLAAADLVITGEGSFDAQSLQGKTSGRLRERAAAAGKRCIVFAGRAEVPGEDVLTLSSLERDPQRAMAHAAALLEGLAFGWAQA